MTAAGRIATLEALVRDELRELWAAFDEARVDSYWQRITSEMVWPLPAEPHTWSPLMERLARRINAIEEQVGHASFDMMPTPLIADGAWPDAVRSYR